MKRLLIVAFKEVRGSKVFSQLKRKGINYRRRLSIIDGVVFAMAEINYNIRTFHRHESGTKVLDLTLANWDEGATLMEQAIDNNNLRINR